MTTMTARAAIRAIYEELKDGTLEVNGTVALPTGAATQTTLAAVLAALTDVIVTAPRPNCTGDEQAVEVTMSETPWTALDPVLAVPDWASEAFIIAPDGLTRYRLNGTPGGAPTSTASAGSLMAANEKRSVTLEPGTDRTLELKTAAISGKIIVEWRP